MFIVPLTSSITPMETMSQKKQTESTDDGEATFFDVFESLVKNVKETDAQVQKDSVDLMLGDMGTDGSISVPSDQADNVRMQLSIQGYPKSTFNFDVWNSGIGIWSTDTEKKVLQIQQLQTHLMKAINTISAVKNSYVIITMPENSNYVIPTNSEEPRVSVKLDLKNGAQLTSDQVEGIYALVLNSLPGLERENISILDSDGKLLSGENTTVEEDVL